MTTPVYSTSLPIIRRDLSTEPPFGRLTAIAVAGRDKQGMTLWRCLCSCGNELIVRGSSLTGGNTQSCGCIAASKNHGMKGSPEYGSWKHMIERCCDENCKDYRNYGRRGIKVCPEWRESFAIFFAHIGSKPTPAHSLDRFPDQNGNYEPGNVRWATPKEQQNNRRSNRLLTARGQTMTLAQWCRQLGLKHYTAIIGRLNRGWSDEDALFAPTRRQKERRKNRPAE